MKYLQRGVIAADVVLILACGYLGGERLAQRRWGWVVADVITIIVMLLCIQFAVRALRKEQDGQSREASENCGSTGADPSAARVASAYASLSASLAITAQGTASGASPELEPAPPLEVVKVDEPIRAWKQAWVTWTVGPRAMFGGIAWGDAYSAEATATCNAWERKNQFRVYSDPEPYLYGPQHPAPLLECGCGFWALKDQPAIEGAARLTVDLYGRIIEYERGYRAEKQQVLRVEFAPTCAWCGDVAVGLSYIAPDVLSAVRLPALRPVCEAVACNKGEPIVKLRALSGLLGGVEVCWA